MKTKYMIMSALSALLLAGGIYGDHVKIIASHALIQHAWSASLKSGEPVKVWPWLSSYPVAKLSITGQDSFVVMSGASSAVMPYAPLWHEGSSMPGQNGVTLISGDRKTHFSALKMLTPTDRFELVTSEGRTLSYQVEEVRVVNDDDIKLDNIEKQSVMILSTSYPLKSSSFGMPLKNSMRLIVIARKIDEPLSVQMAGL